jgi:putative transposase
MNYKRHKQYRLPYFNYASTGLYFVTICSHHRKNIFGTVVNRKVILSKIGLCIFDCINNLPLKLSYVTLDEFVIMPNHLHAIIQIVNPNIDRTLHEKRFQPEKASLSIIIRNFKSTVTLLTRRDLAEAKVWQPRFHDRIIRNERELHSIRKYIQDNPMQWEEDRNNPENLMM